jgi:hypothetical protein
MGEIPSQEISRSAIRAQISHHRRKCVPSQKAPAPPIAKTNATAISAILVDCIVTSACRSSSKSPGDRPGRSIRLMQYGEHYA